MSRVATIFRKELRETLRDTRSVVAGVVLSVVVLPLGFGGIAVVLQWLEARAESERSSVAVAGLHEAPALRDLLAADPKIELREVVEEAVGDRVSSGELDGGLVVSSVFADRLRAEQTATVRLYTRASDLMDRTEQRIRVHLDAWEDDRVAERIRARELDGSLFDALVVERVDVSPPEEVLGKALGGFLPYVFVLWCFWGCLHVGTDLGAGERERGTLETILSSPASRLEIALGKLGVVALSGVVSGALGLAGLAAGLFVLVAGEPEVLDVARAVVTPAATLTILGLLVPLGVFFASVVLAVAVHARSVKEAGSSLTPMGLLVLVPVMLGLLPGMELDGTTAWVPVLNVSLATRELVAGTLSPIHLANVFGSLLGLAGLGVAFCVRWFDREEVLFRS